MTSRPKIIHFITGLRADFGGRPFILPNALAILSAHLVYPDHKIRVYYAHEPTGLAWGFVKDFVTEARVEAPAEIFGRPISHYAHSADVLRLQQLIADGGIYFDLDSIILKPISELPEDRVVMGMEHNVEGLCNAFIAAPKEADFLCEWLDRYRSFDQEDWGGHSILLPYSLAQEMADQIHIEPPQSFFTPHYDPSSLVDLFERVVETSAAYSIHLWESLSWDWLNRLTIKSISQEDTTYNLHARKVLAEFPELAGMLESAEWRLQLTIYRNALPGGALHRSPFWYLAFHNGDDEPMARQDVEASELQKISSQAENIIVLERLVQAPEPPSHWTIHPVDKHRNWLAPLNGVVDVVAASGDQNS